MSLNDTQQRMMRGRHFPSWLKSGTADTMPRYRNVCGRLSWARWTLQRGAALAAQRDTSQSSVAVALLCVALGFGAYRYWTLYNPYALRTDDDSPAVALINLMAAAWAAVLLVWFRSHQPTPRTRSALVLGSLALMLASSVCVYLSPVLEPANAMAQVRNITCALGMVWGGAMWMDIAARMTQKHMFAGFVAGFAVSCAANIMGSHLPLQTASLVNLLMPALSVTLCWYASKVTAGQSSMSAWAANSPSKPVSRDTRIMLFTTIALLSFVFGIAFGYPNGQPRVLPALMRDAYLLFDIVVLAGLLWWVCERSNSLGLSALPLLLGALAAASIALLTVDPNDESGISMALLRSATTLCGFFAVLAAYHVGSSGWHSPTYALGVYYALGHMAFFGAGRLMSARAGVSLIPEALLAILMVCLIASIVCAVRCEMAAESSLVEVRRGCMNAVDGVVRAAHGNTATQTTTGTEAADSSTATPTQASFDAICDAHDLTERERTITRLLLRGRNRRVIAEDLGYAENTVRNYIRSIYLKLDVHTKQELIDCFETPGEKPQP